MTTAYEIVSRLVDNYEDKGDFIDEFDQLISLIARAIESSEHCERIKQISLDNGIVEAE